MDDADADDTGGGGGAARQQEEAVEEVRKRYFLSTFYIQRSFCQDRLGTKQKGTLNRNKDRLLPARVP